MFKGVFEDGTETQAAVDVLYDWDFENDFLPGEEYIRQFDNNRYFRDAVLLRAAVLGYDGQTDDELSSFLMQRCKQAGVGLSRQTVTNWITQSAPTGSAVGRENVYQLCFALSMNEKQAAEFFLKAFLEKPFHFKDIRECVYFFCLKNGLSYSEAQNILDRIEQYELQEEPISEDNTAKIGEAVDAFRSEDRLIAYIAENKATFSRQSKTAMERFQSLLTSCYEIAAEERLLFDDDMPKGVQVKTPDALLSVIYGFSARKTEVDKNGVRHKVLQKSISKSNFPKAIKTNFPQRQQIENILKGKSSYDAMRKALIVLEFYSFYGDAFVKKADAYDLFDEFTVELNNLLGECGYVQMYWRNPFDWMIGYCAFSGHPLEEFRDLIDVFYLDEIDKH